MPGKAIFSQSTLPSRVIQALRKKNRGMRRSRRQGFVSSLRIGLPETKKQGRRVATVAPAATYSEVEAASKEQENCNTCNTPPSSSHHQLRNTVTAIHHVSQHNTPRLNQSSDFTCNPGVVDLSKTTASFVAAQYLEVEAAPKMQGRRMHDVNAFATVCDERQTFILWGLKNNTTEKERGTGFKVGATFWKASPNRRRGHHQWWLWILGCTIGRCCAARAD